MFFFNLYNGALPLVFHSARCIVLNLITIELFLGKVSDPRLRAISMAEVELTTKDSLAEQINEASQGHIAPSQTRDKTKTFLILFGCGLLQLPIWGKNGFLQLFIAIGTVYWK